MPANVGAFVRQQAPTGSGDLLGGAGSTPTPAVPSRPSIGRRPRAYLKVNGQVASLLSCMVEDCATLSSDRFDAELDPWAQPQGMDAAFWMGVKGTDAQVEVWMGFLEASDQVSGLPSNAVRMITGKVDEVRARYTGGTLTIYGRDLASNLIDKTVDQNFTQVPRASDIIKKLANLAGLEADVSETAEAIGQSAVSGVYSALALGVPMWDVVTTLAIQEGFEAWVNGATLFFHPPSSSQASGSGSASAESTPAGLSIYVSRQPNGAIVSNCSTLEIRRALTLTDPFTRVRSHSIAAGGSTEATSGNAATATQNFEIDRPNLSASQSKQLADAVRAAAQRHGFVIDFEMEGDLTTVARAPVTLSGTNSAADGTYRIDTVSRQFSPRDGLKMRIRAITPPGSPDSTEVPE